MGPLTVQLLSLFFLTIGKNRESPAAYCQLATLKVRASQRAAG